jgi:hypothetical protein
MTHTKTCGLLDEPRNITIVERDLASIPRRGRNPTLYQMAMDQLLPGFMQASAQHDCVLLWSEIGELNAVCHDQRLLTTIAFIEEFDATTGYLKEEHRNNVSVRLRYFKEIINQPKVPTIDSIKVKEREEKMATLKALSDAVVLNERGIALCQEWKRLNKEQGKPQIDYLAITRDMC